MCSLAGAIALSLALLAGAWLVYDALWSSPLARRPALAAGVSFALVVAAALALTHLLSGRGAFIHLGAMLGTIMAANVWRRIIPAQTQMLAATRAGRPAAAEVRLADLTPPAGCAGRVAG